MAVRVLILGMHRSGTSAAARVVNLLGVPLGDSDDWMPPGPSNPAGHWESSALSALNDQVLERLGGSWMAPPPIEDAMWRRPEVEALQREATARFRQIHPTKSWVWTDPRNCLTLPFWRPVLGPRPMILLVFRDPREVGASLSARNGCSPLYGVALWERYVRAALANAAGLPTFVVGYADLLGDPVGVSSRIDEFLHWAGFEGAGIPDAEAIRAFMDENLHRARAEPNASELSAAQKELARCVESLAGFHERLAAVPLPAETPLTEVLVNERRQPELIQLDARARRAEALAEARDSEIERAKLYVCGLEAHVAKHDEEITELRALAEGQAESLGLRIAEVEGLGAVLAERSALAARHLIENRSLRAELERLGAENTGHRSEFDRLAGQNHALAGEVERLGRENGALAGELGRLGGESGALAAESDRLRSENDALRIELDRLHQMAAQAGQSPAGWLEMVATRSFVLRTLPHGSRRRAACTALVYALGARRRTE